MNRLRNDERFAELLKEHHTQLFGYLYALVHSVSDAEDLYQETCMVLWEKFDDYREGTSFFSWAMATARFKMLNFVRTRKRRSQFTNELQMRLDEAFNELDTSTLQFRLEALQDCKGQLREEDRGLLDACYGSQLSFRETAEQLGRPPKRVYKSLDRIRALLMKCIETRLTEHDMNGR